MRARPYSFLLYLTWGLAAVFFTNVCVGQEKEKPKTGTTVETWRQSLPPEAETQKATDEVNPTTLPPNDEIQKTILSLERAWVDAVKVRDADSLSQIISGDFTLVSNRGAQVTDRRRYLEQTVRDQKLTSLELENVTVRMFGRTAVVAGVLKQTATLRDMDLSGSYLFTDVWIYRGGTWQVVSRHESLLPQK